MARTVDSPILLPRHWATPGAQIRSAVTSQQAGIANCARGLNSLVEQHRGQLIADAQTDGILTETSATQTAYYRPPLWGVGGSASAECWVYCSAHATNDSTITFAAATSGDSQTIAVTGGGATGWRQTSADLAFDLTYATDDVSVSYTGAVITIYSIMVFWPRGASTLDAYATASVDGYTTPIDLAITDDEQPLSPALVYSMHGTARGLHRRTGPAIMSAFPAWPLTTSTAPSRCRRVVPKGVETLTLDIRGYGLAVSIYTQHGMRGTRMPTADGWRSIDLPVHDLDVLDMTIRTGYGAGAITGFSGRWGARQ